MDEKTVFSFYNESVVCVQFIAESLVDLDKRSTNKGIVLHKKLWPFLYICIIIFSFTNISEDLHMYLKKGKNRNIVIQKNNINYFSNFAN